MLQGCNCDIVGKPLTVIPAYHITMCCTLAVPVPIQPHISGLGEVAEDGPMVWASATQVEVLDKTSSF